MHTHPESIEELARRPVGELTERYLGRRRPVPKGLLERLEDDSRLAARELGRRLRRREHENRSEAQRLHRLLRFEIELWGEGYETIAGVDEAGMAPLAGPVVAAAVVLPRSYKLRDLDDSKKILDERKREALAARIKAEAVCWGVGRAEPEEIDTLNIYHAGLLAMTRALRAMSVVPQYVLVDGRTLPLCEVPQRRIVHGDALSASIAAASLIAKTTRDALMREFDRLYPGFGFAAHKGYPTAEHCRAIHENGVLPIHRRSFGPVRDALAPSQLALFSDADSSPSLPGSSSPPSRAD